MQSWKRVRRAQSPEEIALPITVGAMGCDPERLRDVPGREIFNAIGKTLTQNLNKTSQGR